ncbi:addiction module antidote protein, HigA family [Patescibacteria group bacterium]|nr:MAG: addiction module antidote protein, HigA family [Patescibacteria group bacterium]
MAKQKPVHPGEILDHEFLRPHKLTQYRLAKDIAVPARRINEIIHGTRSVSSDTALRLARYFGTTPQFWLNLQMHYDLDCVQDAVAKRIERDVSVFATA